MTHFSKIENQLKIKIRRDNTSRSVSILAPKLKRATIVCTHIYMRTINIIKAAALVDIKFSALKNFHLIRDKI
jgi:hypothetical protein